MGSSLYSHIQQRIFQLAFASLVKFLYQRGFRANIPIYKLVCSSAVFMSSTNRMICVQLPAMDEWDDLRNEMEKFQQELQDMADSQQGLKGNRIFESVKNHFKHATSKIKKPDTPHNEPPQEGPSHRESDNGSQDETELRRRYYDDVHAFRTIFENLSEFIKELMKQQAAEQQQEAPEQAQDDGQGGDQDSANQPEDEEDDGNGLPTVSDHTASRPPVFYILRSDN
jgi:hypothetical protein